MIGNVDPGAAGADSRTRISLTLDRYATPCPRNEDEAAGLLDADLERAAEAAA
jgi:hypothetical protein